MVRLSIAWRQLLSARHASHRSTHVATVSTQNARKGTRDHGSQGEDQGGITVVRPSIGQRRDQAVAMRRLAELAH